jgi:hypothetical protein
VCVEVLSQSSFFLGSVRLRVVSQHEPSISAPERVPGTRDSIEVILIDRDESSSTVNVTSRDRDRDRAHKLIGRDLEST